MKPIKHHYSYDSYETAAPVEDGEDYEEDGSSASDKDENGKDGSSASDKDENGTLIKAINVPLMAPDCPKPLEAFIVIRDKGMQEPEDGNKFIATYEIRLPANQADSLHPALCFGDKVTIFDMPLRSNWGDSPRETSSKESGNFVSMTEEVFRSTRRRAILRATRLAREQLAPLLLALAKRADALARSAEEDKLGKGVKAPKKTPKKDCLCKDGVQSTKTVKENDTTTTIYKFCDECARGRERAAAKEVADKVLAEHAKKKKTLTRNVALVMIFSLLIGGVYSFNLEFVELVISYLGLKKP